MPTSGTLAGGGSCSVERETGIEPATNGLGSRYSTIELLPLGISKVYPFFAQHVLRRFYSEETVSVQAE